MCRSSSRVCHSIIAVLRMACSEKSSSVHLLLLSAICTVRTPLSDPQGMKAVKDFKGKGRARADDDESFVALEASQPRHVETRTPRRSFREWYSTLPQRAKDRLFWSAAFAAFVLVASLIGLAVGLLLPSSDLIGGLAPVTTRETIGKSELGTALGEPPKWSRWGARGGKNGYDAVVALGGGK